MIYQDVFNHRFIILIAILVIGCLSVLFFWIDNSYMDCSEYLKNHPVAKYCIRICITVLLISYFWLSALPIIKDKKLIDSNQYDVVYGTVLHDVYDGGMFGLSKSINIQVDGKEYEYSVAGIDENIHQGDFVKITYLPHSMYAVIELN